MSTTVEAIYEDGKLLLQQPLPLPDKTHVRVTVEMHSSRVGEIAAVVRNLENLASNWDSYGARPIDPNCIAFVIDKVLTPTMQAITPAPAVVPLNKGGIMLEWHQGGIDLEVRVEKPGEIQMFYADEQTGAEISEDISLDITPLRSAIDQLSARG